MTRRIRPGLAIVLVSLALVGLVGRVASDGSRPTTRGQLVRAVPGMTRAEVEELFGNRGLAVRFARDPQNPDWAKPIMNASYEDRPTTPADSALDPDSTWRAWRSEGCYFFFRFRDGVVVEYGGGAGVRPNAFDRLRARLGL